MRSVDDVIDELVLQHAYDPQKRHEYYLRTRQLKGRQKGQQDQTSGRTSSARVSTIKKHHQQPDMQTSVEALRRRLESLKRVLAELVKKAKARSGVETKSSSSSSKSSSSKSGGGSKSDRKPLTAKQKEEARKRSKDWRDKHKQTKSPTNEIASLKKQIKEIEAKIQAALEKDRQRQHASSMSNQKTASKGR